MEMLFQKTLGSMCIWDLLSLWYIAVVTRSVHYRTADRDDIRGHWRVEFQGVWCKVVSEVGEGAGSGL